MKSDYEGETLKRNKELHKLEIKGYKKNILTVYKKLSLSILSKL